MRLPLQISFHGTPRSASIVQTIQFHAAKLDQFCNHITSCRVVVDEPHKHHQTGNRHRVRIDIRVPGDEIIVTREPGDFMPHQELQAAVADAFEHAARQLQNYVQRQRREVKAHYNAAVNFN